MKHALFLLPALLLTGCGQSPMSVANQQIKQPKQGSTAETATPTTQVETGRVNWLRNLDEAKAKAKEADKPILLLFQEIPG